jgi:hypothetical protein
MPPTKIIRNTDGCRGAVTLEYSNGVLVLEKLISRTNISGAGLVFGFRTTDIC